MLKVKDQCVKVNNITNEVEKQYKGSKEPKIYTVKTSSNDGTVTIYNNDEVLFDSYGNVIIAPPVVGRKSSNWTYSKLVKI